MLLDVAFMILIMFVAFSWSSQSSTKTLMSLQNFLAEISAACYSNKPFCDEDRRCMATDYIPDCNRKLYHFVLSDVLLRTRNANFTHCSHQRLWNFTWHKCTYHWCIACSQFFWCTHLRKKYQLWWKKVIILKSISFTNAQLKQSPVHKPSIVSSSRDPFDILILVMLIISPGSINVNFISFNVQRRDATSPNFDANFNILILKWSFIKTYHFFKSVEYYSNLVHQLSSVACRNSPSESELDPHNPSL